MKTLIKINYCVDKKRLAAGKSFAASLLLILVVSVTSFAQGVYSDRKVSAKPEVMFPKGKTSLRLPFNNDLGLVFFYVRVNGSKPLLFNLDTGYDVSVIDARLAKKLKLKVNDPKLVPAPGGTVEVGEVSGVTINGNCERRK